MMFNIKKSSIFLLTCCAFGIFSPGCVPFDKIYSHEFNSGYFNLKSSGLAPQKIYIDINGDSLSVYPVIQEGKESIPDKSGLRGTRIEKVLPGNFLYGSTFVKTSADVDLSTVILKFRPAAKGVASQLNSNVNGLFYIGFRKDFFRFKASASPVKEITPFIRHTGFDFGLFGGIGITPVNPTVTMNRTIQEYDGIVFQKGIAFFATYESLSVGIALGFDNLLNPDRKIWIYNQKPWLGIVLGIANF
ncbi:MAG: hypothetical protein Q8868_05830 [Bacteroidota bacterium]|nr:hypothetical protein [Bacteroidota bacterium]